jgi:hypothetical protein
VSFCGIAQSLGLYQATYRLMKALVTSPTFGGKLGDPLIDLIQSIDDQDLISLGLPKLTKGKLAAGVQDAKQHRTLFAAQYDSGSAVVSGSSGTPNPNSQPSSASPPFVAPVRLSIVDDRLITSTARAFSSLSGFWCDSILKPGWRHD